MAFRLVKYRTVCSRLINVCTYVFDLCVGRVQEMIKLPSELVQRLSQDLTESFKDYGINTVMENSLTSVSMAETLLHDNLILRKKTN